MILKAFEQHFPGEYAGRIAVREYLADACLSFINSGLADPKFFDELLSGELQKVWACISEALVAGKLTQHTFGHRNKIGEGPDFLVMNGEQRVWIEVVCPEPSGVPTEWLDIQFGTCAAVPHKEILLRWMSAIQAKAEKQIGSKDGKTKSYLASGITGPGDVYVIAVNGCRLRNGPFPGILGISQFPYAAEAVFPIGPFGYQIDKNSLKAVGGGHQYRPFVINKNASQVPSESFLDPRYAPISAVWAIDLNGGLTLGNHEPMVVVHNPLATNPLPVGFLPGDNEYISELKGDIFSMRKYPAEKQSCE